MNESTRSRDKSSGSHSQLKCLAFLCLQLHTITTSTAAKFEFIGPQVSVTLKEPFSPSSSDSPPPNIPNGSNQFLSLSGISPHIQYRIQSLSPPFPQIVSCLKSFAAHVGYKYAELKSRPSFLGADFVVDVFGEEGVSVDVATGYNVKDKAMSMGVRIGGQRSFCFAKLSNKAKRMFEYIEGSYKMSLPLNSISSLTMTPKFDFLKSAPSFVISGEAGTRRTTAILDLNMEDPSLQVIHQLDERNTIAPEISLTTAKILYNWYVSFSSSGSLRARVDPTSAIDVTWTDDAASNGKWVTQFKLPLEGSPGPLAADIRVRRHFDF